MDNTPARKALMVARCKVSRKGSKKGSKKGPKKPRAPKKAKATKRQSQKRPLNAYMLKVQEAKRANSSSFTYKGHTYKRGTVPSGMTIYRKA